MPVKRIKAFLNTYRKNPLAIFLVKGFIFFMLWDLLVFPYLVTISFNEWTIERLLDFSKWTLGWFYPDVFVISDELYINGVHCVHVGIPCNGVEVIGVFASIVLAYQARWFHKAWVIISGSILILFLNAARITFLAGFIYHHQHRAFDINHKYVFTIILYGILLLVFSLWSSKFGTKIPPSTE